MALESDTHTFGLVSASSQLCGFIQIPGHSQVSVSSPGKPCPSPSEGAVKSLVRVPSHLEETPVSAVSVEEDHEGSFSSNPSKLWRQADGPMP